MRAESETIGARAEGNMTAYKEETALSHKQQSQVVSTCSPGASANIRTGCETIAVHNVCRLVHRTSTTSRYL